MRKPNIKTRIKVWLSSGDALLMITLCAIISVALIVDLVARSQ